MGTLPACSHESTIVWLRDRDFNKELGGKATWEWHKDTACCFEQILEAAAYKTVAVLSLTSHFTNYPSKTSKTCWVPLEKQGQTYEQSSHMNTPVFANQQRLTISSSVQTLDAV